LSGQHFLIKIKKKYLWLVLTEKTSGSFLISVGFFQMLDGIVTYFQKRNAKGQKNQALGIVRRFLVHLQR
jgi:uncharacterized membrane protein